MECFLVTRLLIVLALMQSSMAVAANEIENEIDRTPSSVPSRIEEVKDEEFQRPKLFSAPLQSKLEGLGIGIFGTYLGDFATVLNQPNNEFRHIGHFYLGSDLDMQKLMGWNNGRVVVSLVANYGKSFSPMVGDFQFTSNIESGGDSIRPYEFFVEQKFFDQSASLILGMFDVNSEFNVTPGSLLFLNSSFGMDAGLAASGFAGPSTFPMTTLGLRAKYNFTEQIYLQGALMDGKPGPLESFWAEQFYLDPSNEGFFHVEEVGYSSANADAEGLRKLAAAFWGYTKSQPALDPALVDVKKAPWGAYFLADYGFSTRYSSFLRYGISNDTVQFSKSNLSLGFVAKGFFGDLDHDRWGIGLTSATFSTAGLAVALKPEDTFEFTVAWRVCDGIYVQPNLQYVLSPSGDETVNSPIVSTVRLEINL